MSLGGEAYQGTCPQIEIDAVNYALSKGVTVVAASGNAKSPVSCPARIPGVIAVGAIDRYNNIVNNAAWGSNFGPEQSVMAPGIQIAAACSCLDEDGQPNDDYELKFNGTSAATPFVAGVVALMKSVNPSLRPAEVKDFIQRTATNPGPNAGTLPNASYGHGIVNALEAVKLAQQTR
jgi:subtilisin family serine protease